MDQNDSSRQPDTATKAGVKQEIFGTLPDGREVKIYTLANRNGLVAKVTEYGAILVSFEAPDREGTLADLTHGFDTLEGWLGNTHYLGASVGRFANRIKAGKFILDGETRSLATNNEPGGIPCHLHGGVKGFDKVLWTGKISGKDSVELVYDSPDGEEGYPGNLTAKVTYTLNDDDELVWEASATTDAPTIVNMVHHSYWNLSGDPRTLVNDHLLTLEAGQFLTTDSGLIPTGERTAVAGTPMDFTTAKRIGARVEADFQPLRFGGGYDHCWVLDDAPGVRCAARLEDPSSGRVMKVFTNQPAIQFYGGNFLDGTLVGKQGVAYAKRTGLCLETQGFPDAPNQPAFPSCALGPGEIYQHVMIHRFSAGSTGSARI